jgi:hypothetical protein
MVDKVGLEPTMECRHVKSVQSPLCDPSKKVVMLHGFEPWAPRLVKTTLYQN